MLPWVLCAILFLVVIALIIKIIFMKISIDEIGVLLGEHLSTDTNTLITVSTGDKQVRHLVAEINTELRTLRTQRRKYLNGDRELKEAVTNISHDLRTPLTAISGYLELLEQEEKSEVVEHYLSFVENRTEALKQLTEELFRYTVILSTEQMKIASVDVRAVLEESLLSFYGAMTENGITPELRITEHQVFRQLNQPALSRVFSNILNNSLKYSDGDLCVELQDSGEIQFSNTASNLDEVQVGKLFNRFFTVETAHNSTGLGLSISKTLVEQMGGAIRAEYDNGMLRIVIDFSEQKI